GLKMLSHPDSARRGNLIAAAGMTIAIFATIFLYRDDAGQALGNYPWIFGGLVIGTIIGTLAAKKVQMTAMPEMVSLFNGMGGACAMLISVVEYHHMHQPSMGMLLVIILGMVIGTVSFTGSRSEEHTSELQSRENLVCRLLLEKKKSNASRGQFRKC